MALTQLAPPYPVFTDKNGDPLDNGYLYFGEVNKNPETNPIQVYYDSAFTQPAAQPLRTSNGYVMRNGSPALIYANSQFSVTVRDKNNVLVIYSPVGFGIRPGVPIGSIFINVQDFGAVGDGVNDDTSAIQAALDSSSGIVYFPYGTYLISSSIYPSSNQTLLGGDAILTMPNGTFEDGIIVSAKENVVIDGLHIKGATGGNSFDNAIVLGGASDGVIIQNCLIEDIGIEAVQSPPTSVERGFGITIDGACTNTKILNNTIQNIKGYGAFRGDCVTVRTSFNTLIQGNTFGVARRMQIAVIDDAVDVRIIGNHFEDGYLNAIDIEPNTVNTTGEIVISDNTIRNYGSKPGATIGSQFFGIDLHSNEFENITITGNIITAGNANALSPIHGQNVARYTTITGNILNCAGFAPSGMTLNAGNGFKDLVIADNIIRDFTTNGIIGDKNDRVTCTGNMITSTSATGRGINFTGGFRANIANNLVDLSGSITGIYLRAFTTLSVANNNVVVDSGLGIHIYDNAGTVEAVAITANVISDTSGTATTGLFMEAAGAGGMINTVVESNSINGFTTDYSASGSDLTTWVSVQGSSIGFKNARGLDFSDVPSGSGVTDESKLLNDYEEGTWACEIADASTGGNVATTSATYARYVKVGKQVTVFLAAYDINITGLTTGNVLFIRGLPFVIQNSPRIQSAGSVVLDRIGRANTYVSAYAEYNRSWLDLRGSSTAGSGAQDTTLLVSDIGASGGSDIQALSISYVTA